MANKILKGLRRRNRFLVVVLSGIGLLLIYFIASSHYLMLSKSKELVLQKLRAISLTVSSQIDGDKHEYLVNAYSKKNDIVSTADDSVYQELQGLLQEFHQLNDLESPIYTMVFNESSNEYEFILTSSSEPYYRHMFVNYPAQLRMNYAVGGVIDEYQTENGTWLSAFAPVKNSKGEVVAILQVDQEFDSFIAEARQDLVKNILVTSVVFFPFMIFLFTYMRNTLLKEEQNQLMLEERNEEIEIQNEMIKEANLKLEKANLEINARNESLDKQVAKRTQELVSANQDLETFLYRSSHDIQGPIASIKGIFHMSKVDQDNTSTYFKMINDSVEQLDLRVKGINAVFEVKNRVVGREKLRLREFLNYCIGEEVSQLNYDSFRYDLSVDDSIEINTDPDLLRILFREMIKNSFQFRNGSEVYFNIEAQQKGVKHIKLIIRDNGQGIAESHRPELFDMFKRWHEKSQGSGLGLYAVKMALDKLHGKIRVLDVKEGAAFEIIVPTF